MTDIDATFEQNVFNLAQRQWIADVHHNSEPDDLGRTVEITEGILQSYSLEDLNGWLKTIYSDNTYRGHHSFIPIHSPGGPLKTHPISTLPPGQRFVPGA